MHTYIFLRHPEWRKRTPWSRDLLEKLPFTPASQEMLSSTELTNCLPCSEKPITGTYAEPNATSHQFTSFHYISLRWSILILSTYLYLVLPSDFQTRILYALLITLLITAVSLHENWTNFCGLVGGCLNHGAWHHHLWPSVIIPLSMMTSSQMTLSACNQTGTSLPSHANITDSDPYDITCITYKGTGQILQLFELSQQIYIIISVFSVVTNVLSVLHLPKVISWQMHQKLQARYTHFLTCFL